jgi:hypothetical protein
MQSARDISHLAEQEILRISDEKLTQRIRELAVTPYPVKRSWDYGAKGEQYVCWTVLEHRESNTGIAFCLGGFGPSYPWGLVSLSGPRQSIGMDSSWFASLEQAMRDCMAWDGPNPPGYEVD